MHPLRAVVLVEGESDRSALTALARRRGLDLAGTGVRIVPMGGATNIGHFLGRYGPPVRVAGLYDAAEEGYFRRALERAGYGADLSRVDLAAAGFHGCVADLEDELVRALGVAGVERVIESERELASFRILQQQPAQRGRDVTAQLRRFFGARSGRKERYARLLVEALDSDRMPGPLDAVLADAGG